MKEDELQPQNPEVLREIFGYWKEFDVFLTAPFRDSKLSTTLFEHRFPFYEKIGAVISNLGKSVYLPHKELDFSQHLERQHRELFDIVIPCSKLEIAYFPPSPHFESESRKQDFMGLVMVSAPAYSDIDMIEWDLMWSRARTSRVPSISLYHYGSKYSGVRSFPNQIDEIPFTTEEEALKELDKSIRQFFK